MFVVLVDDTECSVPLIREEARVLAVACEDSLRKWLSKNPYAFKDEEFRTRLSAVKKLCDSSGLPHDRELSKLYIYL